MILARRLLVAMLLLPGLVYAEKHPLCKAPNEIQRRQINPLGIFSYMASNPKVQSTEDLICCLPQEFRDNFMVSPASLAAQTGTPDSPRVFLFDPSDTSTMFTINGANAEARLTSNVEFVSDNKTKNKLEYYDIATVNGRPHMSGANPQQCMLCHGNTQGQEPPGGPRSLLEGLSGDWPRLVGGSFDWSHLRRKAKECPEDQREAKLRALMADRSLKALRTNPQFECLSRVQPKDPTVLDRMFEDLNERSFAMNLEFTDGYEKLKYVFLGHFAGCDQPRDFPPSTKSQFEKLSHLESWIPSAELAKMDGTDFLAQEVRSSKTQKEACLKLASKALQQRKEIQRKQDEEIAKLAAGKSAELVFDQSPFLCSAKTAGEFCDHFDNNESMTLSEKYAIDTLFKPSRAASSNFIGGGKAFDPKVRYLLESRWIDASQFSMTPGGNYQRGGNFSDAQGELHRIAQEGWKFRYSELLKNQHKESAYDEAQLATDCMALAQKSLTAFKSESVKPVSSKAESTH